VHKEMGQSSLRVRASLAVLAVFALLALGVGAPSAQALPGKFWGVVPQTEPSPGEFQRLKRGGVRSMRIPVDWGNMQPVRELAPDWANVDRLVASAATVGIEIFPFLYGAPAWAVPTDRSVASNPPRFLPVRNGKQRAGWKSFLRQAVQRYGPRGSFWAENPSVPKRPIRIWQIGNEVNFKYFVARPNPAEYGKLVKLSYAALKAADRGARIVLSGLFAHPIEARIKRPPRQAYTAPEFLTQMYRSTPGIKRKFHGVALHPYTGTYKRLPLYIEEIRDLLVENGDAGKGLFLTELGWSSQSPRGGNDGFAKGRNGQARELKGAFRLLRKNQRRWRLQRVHWFSVNDLEGACNFCDGSGLFEAGFHPKPSWFAYARFAGGRP
jgi:polysaccharide biosynthesis protein PslG